MDVVVLLAEAQNRFLPVRAGLRVAVLALVTERHAPLVEELLPQPAQQEADEGCVEHNGGPDHHGMYCSRSTRPNAWRRAWFIEVCRFHARSKRLATRRSAARSLRLTSCVSQASLNTVTSSSRLVMPAYGTLASSRLIA